jgi:hypothetical protein
MVEITEKFNTATATIEKFHEKNPLPKTRKLKRILRDFDSTDN